MQNTTESFAIKELKEKVQLVLNGGGRMLNSATIPVEWHFSSELIAQKPQYVVICEHEFSLEEFEKKHEFCFIGRRYLCKVQDLVKYIQLFRSGTHNLVVLVFCGEKAWQNASFYVKKDSDSSYQYQKEVWYRDLKLLEFDNIYATAVEFEVSKELFAEKPKGSKWEEFVWSWVNRWHNNDPIDECAYRKRKIFAFTLKPPLFVLVRVFAWFFGTLFVLVGSLVVFLLGWKPNAIFSRMKPLYWDLDDFEMDLTEFGFCRYSWRIWKKEEYTEKKYVPKKKIPVFMVPIFLILELAVAAVIGFVFYLFISSVWLFVLMAGATLGLIILLYTKVCNSEKNKQKRAETEKRKKEEIKAQEKKEEADFLAFLRSNASLSTAGDKVNIERIKNVTGTMNKLKIVFWSTKANVCRPFEK